MVKPFDVLQTTVPTIYTATPMDPFLDLLPMRGDSKRIFGLPAKYVLPVELNFAYPVGNVSIGR